MKMSNTEEKIYPLLCEKRNLKEIVKENSNINLMSYKPNGFINIIYASIILLVIVIIYLVLVK